jgi:hypothetical protein
MEPIEIGWKSFARWHFEFALNDVRVLLKMHDNQTQRKRGKPDASLEVLKRSGLILTVTAWESFIEDTLVEQVATRLKKISTPQELNSVFNTVAEAWLNPQVNKGKPKPPDLIKWTGEGWKKMIMDRIQEEASVLNTPNSKNVEKLLKKYLNLQVRDTWKWRGMTFEAVRRRLDALIVLRGNIAHRSKTVLTWMPRFPSESFIVRRKQLVNAISLIENLVQCTEQGLGIAPYSKLVSLE